MKTKSTKEQLLDCQIDKLKLNEKISKEREKLLLLMEVLIDEILDGEELELECQTIYYDDNGNELDKPRYSYRVRLPVMGDVLTYYSETGLPPSDKTIMPTMRKMFMETAIYHICERKRMKKLVLKDLRLS